MFSKKPAQHPQAAPPPRAQSRAASSTFSIIGADVVIRGNIEASADLHIDGRVVGDIACASLVMGESSSVAGEIVAESARIAGTVTGTLRVRDLVVLRGASVEGDVSYETISIEQGAAVSGRFAPRSAGLAPITVASGLTVLIEDAEFTAAG
jgi:cytoskeletal protein CcmA (bactofilin family)